MAKVRGKVAGEAAGGPAGAHLAHITPHDDDEQ